MPSHYDDKHGGKSKVNKGAEPKKRKKPEHSRTKAKKKKPKHSRYKSWQMREAERDTFHLFGQKSLRETRRKAREYHEGRDATVE